jgi:hypothetical protein
MTGEGLFIPHPLSRLTSFATLPRKGEGFNYDDLAQGSVRFGQPVFFSA